MTAAERLARAKSRMRASRRTPEQIAHENAAEMERPSYPPLLPWWMYPARCPSCRAVEGVPVIDGDTLVHSCGCGWTCREIVEART